MGAGVSSTTHIVLWKWRQVNQREEYTAEHVNTMVSMLSRHCPNLRYRIICITDDTSGVACESYQLWGDYDDLPNASRKHLPSCYRRLKLYDPATQRSLGIKPGDRIVSLDLDALICQSITPVLETRGTFVGWGLKGVQHPQVFNGSLQMFTAGELTHIWSEFKGADSARAANHAGFMGSDQAWLSYNLVGKPGSVALGYPYIASYPLNVRLLRKHDYRTRIIFYHGTVKPWHPQAFQETKLSHRYWR